MTDAPTRTKLWQIPRYYRDRDIGLYKDPDPGYEDLRFKEGRRLNNEPELIFDFSDAKLADLRKLGCLATNLAPLIDSRISAILAEMAPNQFQLLAARVVASDGDTTEFSFLNIIGTCDCFDRNTTKFTYIHGSPVYASFLRLLPATCFDGKHLARLKDETPLIIVSETLANRLTKLKLKGLRFAFDHEGDDFR